MTMKTNSGTTEEIGHQPDCGLQGSIGSAQGQTLSEPSEPPPGGGQGCLDGNQTRPGACSAQGQRFGGQTHSSQGPIGLRPRPGTIGRPRKGVGQDRSNKE